METTTINKTGGHTAREFDSPSAMIFGQGKPRRAGMGKHSGSKSNIKKKRRKKTKRN
jgi:hypothetical protein|tara:strand:- start:28 stop:198 length:171 start_codon:yes stop_codon:yes gene_type:complete